MGTPTTRTVSEVECEYCHRKGNFRDYSGEDIDHSTGETVSFCITACPRCADFNGLIEERD